MSRLNKGELRIHPAPFKPSHLSIPPSPFTPRTPLTPRALPAAASRNYPAPDPDAQLPPSPLQWLWQCHQCHRTYALGVTRRCLEDGHFFCVGATTVKSWRKKVTSRKVSRHRACASEFDYQGWKSWGRWRRSGRRDSIYDDSSSSSSSSARSSSSSSPTSPSFEGNARTASRYKKTKDCWNTCDYPSECRWGRQFGIHTPLVPEFPVITINSLPDNSTLEAILEAESIKSANDTKKAEKAEKPDFWAALLASATRRKSVPPPSPLADVPQDQITGPEDVARDADGDVVMDLVAPVVSSALATAAIAATAPVVALKGIIGKKSRRGRSKPDSPTSPVGQSKLGFESQENVTEFAPLERTRSRDSGYDSTSDSP